MTTDVGVAQLAVGVIAVYPRRFYLYADEPGPAFDRLVNLLETRKLAERHMAASDQVIGARTGCEDIRVPFGDLHGPQLAEKLAGVFRELASATGSACASTFATGRTRRRRMVWCWAARRRPRGRPRGAVFSAEPGCRRGGAHAPRRRLR